MNHITNQKKNQVTCLADIARLTKDFITPTQAAAVLGCNPYTLNMMAHDAKRRADIGFPVILIGSRVKIPRIPFLQTMGWSGEEVLHVEVAAE